MLFIDITKKHAVDTHSEEAYMFLHSRDIMPHASNFHKKYEEKLIKYQKKFKQEPLATLNREFANTSEKYNRYFMLRLHGMLIRASNDW